MRIPKKYGQSQITKCPFCGNQATTTSAQKVPVCIKHKSSEMNNLKCACGSYLDMKQGKWGPFFICLNCGPINMKKALEVNQI